MKFDDLEKRMRVFETSHDHCALPGLHLVARLDGRGFTGLTKKTLDLERPFDPKFRDFMAETVEHLMQCGFDILFGYTQSDEISLLFDPECDSFGRKLRKINSVLAGEASAKFSLAAGCVAAFDCRVSQLPSQALVRDYFRWRHEDAHRNALNGHCYWRLRDEGNHGRSAAHKLRGLSYAAKNEFLFERGINFNDLPNWQKRGVGLYWESYKKESRSPIDGSVIWADRRRLKRDLELPMKDEYSAYIEAFLRQADETCSV